MSNIDKKTNLPAIGLLTIGRERPGFDPEWGKKVQQAAERLVKTLPWPVVIPSVAATDDGSLRAAIAELKQAGCRGLIVIQPTMGDGRRVPVLSQLWSDPIVIWATGENPDSDRVSACTLVGSHAFASLLRQRNHPFEIVNGHPDDPTTKNQLSAALRLTLTHAQLHTAQVGLVGTHAPGFLNMHVEPATLQRELGVTMPHISVTEYIAATRAVDAQAVAEDRKIVEGWKLRHKDEVPAEALDLNSRYFLATRELITQKHLDAIAIRCWPELPNELGAWPYVAFARLYDDGVALAMEGDADGALTLLLGKWMGYGVGYLSDWLAHDERTLTLWHQGEAPLSFCDPASLSLGRHFNNNKPLVINAHLAAERDITLLRLWHCDGQYRLMAVDARTSQVTKSLLGTCGRVDLNGLNVPDWFDHLCHEGMPHHLGIFQGHHAAELKRLARQLGVLWI